MFNPGLVTAYPVVIGRLDTNETSILVPAGYNDVLREPVLIDSDADGIGEPRRQEIRTTVDAQISTDSWERLRMAAGGRAPNSEIEITLDADELDASDLGDAGGESLFRPGDRLISVSDEDGDPVITYPNDPNESHYRPGLFVSEVRPSGFMAGQNLVCLVFKQRERHVDPAGS